MTVENVISWLNLNEFPYWRVVLSQNPNTVVARSKSPQKNEGGQTIDLDLSESIKFFQECAKLFNNGVYTIQGRVTDASRNGEASYTFNVGESQNTNNQSTNFDHVIAGFQNSHNSEIAGLNRQLDAAIHDKQIAEIKHQYAVDELKRQLREAKANPKTDGLDKVNKIIEVFAPFMSKPSPQPNISGVQQNDLDLDEVSQEIAEHLETIKEALGSDEEFIKGLGVLAGIAKRSPNTLKTLINNYNQN